MPSCARVFLTLVVGSFLGCKDSPCEKNCQATFDCDWSDCAAIEDEEGAFVDACAEACDEARDSFDEDERGEVDDCLELGSELGCGSDVDDDALDEWQEQCGSVMEDFAEQTHDDEWWYEYARQCDQE